ncbi:MAG TPA: bifunctional precorrin-2 dehydrogenase/sirohydrochlorin ferrochelatase [Spirochaetota bacterium]|nr:bifunctional precorrin-2 dehydrogenase/sirohydrochlorin ferrochelatase [Spirochaetota bacterium]HSA15064.1 bifunctional precorrin-2 dehydrogenase/sirohydrochlorin ferrochelatase [Spirochaetota bacterium]
MYYPVMLNIEGRRIAVVGGGEVACRKVKDLLGAGAEVLVIAPEIHPEIEKMAGEMPDRLSLRRRPYERGDIEGVSLVFSAADDPAVNAAVYAEASERNIFINAVDDPGNCSFIVPSMIKRGDLIIAVSTSGASPSMAARIRREIEKTLPGEIEKTLSRMRKAREMIMHDAEFAHLSSSERGAILKKISHNDDLIDRIVAAEGSASLKKLLREIV